MIAASLLLIAQMAAPAEATVVAEPACDKPVYMVVEGVTLDRERMGQYAQAIAKSEIYQKLGGYYITMPRPVAVFEGDVPDNYVNLTVRFPCLANAKAFWNSRVYQEEIMPIRLDPSAGDYTVTVYSEMPLREDMVGKVEQGQFMHDFSGHGIPQAEHSETEEEAP